MLLGTIQQWDDNKGFGFVLVDETNERIFIHINQIKSAGRRPQVGNRVVFKVGNDGKNRKQAVAVQFLIDYQKKAKADQQYQHQQHRQNLMAYGLPVLFIFTLLVLQWLHQIPTVVMVFYGMMSLGTFALYWKDKRAARQGLQRTPEDVLHFFSLLGGWMGALIAQRVLRHKSQKQPFRRFFWWTVLVNIVLFAALVWQNGFVALSKLYPFSLN